MYDRMRAGTTRPKTAFHRHRPRHNPVPKCEHHHHRDGNGNVGGDAFTTLDIPHTSVHSGARASADGNREKADACAVHSPSSSLIHGHSGAECSCDGKC